MITFDDKPMTIEDVTAIARGEQDVTLSPAPEFADSIRRGSAFLEQLLEEDGAIYGVTTGYGDSCTTMIPDELVAELPHHLFTFHGCGMGQVLSPVESRAVVATRLNSLTFGYSGVTFELLQQLTRLLQKNIVPVIPSEGSVGASGDLTPLSYVAAVLCGEREVYDRGERKPTAEVFAREGIEPLRLKPKEGLAIMNGTAVMTALACLAFERAEYLSRLATRITAMATLVLDGNAHHYDEVLFSVKPHAGQQSVAARLRADLHAGEPPRNPDRLQDRYSLRCAPHVIGVLEDSLPWLRQFIENELNSANDNPIIDADGKHVLHGGHFYGGHIAFAMDSLKTAVANIADLLDRQMAQMMDVKFNHGLPANLSGARGERAAINHGLKAVQIGASAWTAEALKLTMPASVFSRSTECHNQDKVSMGTIAARDCLRVLQLTEQVTASALFAVCQGLELRFEQGDLESTALGSELLDTLTAVRRSSPKLDEDRALEQELRELVTRIQSRDWSLYPEH
ncbi:HAL/PAL/TAL family ammonia-lyase [Marinobacter oulmenensis]|uniref:tyrosine ammonia-lyase n=1 Tax=Marinobacter oulmenensis TaxID=643747 RepID=A0A840UAK7_9GAMM|nr:aromatic amino acid ammonia-lyase [Marinobacter oulmenensis]MBB5320260.1 histidine ammonia-lyase [Marinobacter oulmenensis]